MARDLGLELCGRISSDASAALGIVQRQGLGKMRQISTQFFWIQEKVRNDELDIVKVPRNKIQLFVYQARVRRACTPAHGKTWHRAGQRARRHRPAAQRRA